MTKELKRSIKNLPKTPGVYFFKDKEERIIYIGKAKNIRKRVQSHLAHRSFMRKRIDYRTGIIDYSKIRTTDFIPTKSEKDALILESQLVKKYQPYYNLALKDDKNFLYVGFTREKYPRVFTTRQPYKHGLMRIETRINTDKKNVRINPRSNPRESVFLVGPFVAGYETKEFLTVIRKLFPYKTCKNSVEKPCLYYHLGLCSAHTGKAYQYPLIISGLKAFLKMYLADWSTAYPGSHEFASNPYKSANNLSKSELRLECYDISNTQGNLSVGSMVTFVNNKPKKSLYRKFKIKTVFGSNDPRSLAEIIDRRLNHKEWKYPDLIIIDGGKGQLSKLKDVPLPIIGISKRHTDLRGFGTDKRGYRKRSKTQGILHTTYGCGGLGVRMLPELVRDTILAARDEAHRFAITYHRLRRSWIYTDK